SLLAGWHNGSASIGLQRSLVDDKGTSQQLRPHCLSLLPRRLTDRWPIGRSPDHALFQAAARQVGDLLTGLKPLDKISVHTFPVPLRPGEITLGGERCLTGVIARTEDAPPFTGFHDHLGTIDMARNDVDSLINQAVGRLRLFDR